MQQTALDRWLRKKFVYITRIYCNTLPGDIPMGLDVKEAPDESGGRYLYKLSTSSEGTLQTVVVALQMENITYTSRVEDRRVWYGRFLNNPYKSFTYRVIWIMLGIAGLIFSLSGMPQKIWASLASEEAEEELVEAVDDEDVRIYRKSKNTSEADNGSYDAGERLYKPGERSYQPGERLYKPGERLYQPGERLYETDRTK